MSGPALCFAVLCVGIRYLRSTQLQGIQSFVHSGGWILYLVACSRSNKLSLLALSCLYTPCYALWKTSFNNKRETRKSTSALFETGEMSGKQEREQEEEEQQRDPQEGRECWEEWKVAIICCQSIPLCGEWMGCSRLNRCSMRRREISLGLLSVVFARTLLQDQWMDGST